MKLPKFVKSIGVALGIIVLCWFVVITMLSSLFIDFGSIKINGREIVEGEIYHTTDVDELDLSKPILSVPIESIDCYYSIQNSSFFSDEVVAPHTGTIYLTNDNYNKILSMYNDWEEISGRYPAMDIGMQQTMSTGMSEYACDDIKNLIETEPYLYSKQFSLDERMVIFVSESDNVVYFYFS